MKPSPAASQRISIPLRGAQREIVIALPLPPRECSPNWSGRLRDRIRAKREAREWAMYATIKAKKGREGWARVRATAAFTFAVRRTRDDDNLQASLKSYRDGIAGVLWGDDGGWTWDGPPTVTIGPDEGVTITVWPIESEGE